MFTVDFDGLVETAECRSRSAGVPECWSIAQEVENVECGKRGVWKTRSAGVLNYIANLWPKTTIQQLTTLVSSSLKNTRP